MEELKIIKDLEAYVDDPESGYNHKIHGLVRHHFAKQLTPKEPFVKPKKDQKLVVLVCLSLVLGLCSFFGITGEYLWQLLG